MRALEYCLSWLMIGAFYLVIGVSGVLDWCRHVYYHLLNIPHIMLQGKFGSYAIRLKADK